MDDVERYGVVGGPVGAEGIDLSATDYEKCDARPPWYSSIRSFARCTKPKGHEDKHGYAGCFWTTT